MECEGWRQAGARGVSTCDRRENRRRGRGRDRVERGGRDGQEGGDGGVGGGEAHAEPLSKVDWRSWKTGSNSSGAKIALYVNTRGCKMGRGLGPLLAGTGQRAGQGTVIYNSSSKGSAMEGEG